jgi:hypothetical protein
MIKALAAAVALGSLAFVAGDAHACYNETLRRIDPAVATLTEAERLVDAGNTKDAAAWVQIASPAFAKSKLGASPLSDRALSVLARAAIRSNGSDYLGHKGEPSVEERQQALVWAGSVTRAMYEKQPSDPVVTSLFAESLATAPEGQREVLKLLEPLEKSDVLPSAYGYVALAKARAETAAGKPAFLRAPLVAMANGKRGLALARCERMVKDIAICEGRTPAPVKPNQNGRLAVQRENQRIDSFNDMVEGRYRALPLPALAAP